MHTLAVPECKCRERCVPASKGGQRHGLLGLTWLCGLAYLQVSHGVLVEEPSIVATLQGGKEEWTGQQEVRAKYVRM